MTITSIDIIRVITLGLLATTIACNSETGSTDVGSTSNGSTSDGSTSTSPTSTDPTEDTSQGAPPEAPTQFQLGLAQVKQFEFTWAQAVGAEYYQLLESADGQAPFVQVGDDVIGLATSLTVPLFARVNARYMLSACNAFGCTDSEAVNVAAPLVEAIGYFKAANADEGDRFGFSVALSADGSTLAVGAYEEDSNATGIGGDQSDNSAAYAGAVYVFVRDGMNVWTQQAYIKGSNTEKGDRFGFKLALSADGAALAVGASFEDSNATGIDGDQADNSANNSGAAYVFARDAAQVWTQQAYIKASNTEDEDVFGESVALAGDGNTLAVGTGREGSNATGINGDQADNSAAYAGAVYVYGRDAMNVWTQQAYVKASNTDEGDVFGLSAALSGDGGTLAVGAYFEDSHEPGNQGSNVDMNAGAAYVYTRAGKVWTQQAYVKASNANADDHFGVSVALSEDGNTLAVGAPEEDSNATGIGGNQANSVLDAGAVYVYGRDGMNAWTQQAYVKAVNTREGQLFGWSVALAGDASVLAVGAIGEASNATGLGGDMVDQSAISAGAAYVYAAGAKGWTLAYVKAPNTDAGDGFGRVALSEDGRTLAVSAFREGSKASGIEGDQTDNSAPEAGAVYLY